MHLAQLQRYTLWAKRAAGRSELNHHDPPCLTGLNISRMTLREFINIYIIKYKLKKNSVKNTMWKKTLWVFIFCLFVAVVGVVILFMDPLHTFLYLMNCIIFLL